MRISATQVEAQVTAQEGTVEAAKMSREKSRRLLRQLICRLVANRWLAMQRSVTPMSNDDTAAP